MDITVWLRNLEFARGRSAIRKASQIYVEELAAKDIPPIFDFSHLAQLLGLSDAQLASLTASPTSHYHRFEIPKRKGGRREINAPSSTLLGTQRWINQAILSRAAVSPFAHGFVLGRSILTHALLHAGKTALLKMDVCDFFPSIRLPRVVRVFQGFGYPSNVSYFLAALCCVNSTLPQGAATSPAISNIIAKGFDRRIGGLAKRFHLTYSRYADDLAFSGHFIPLYFSSLVRRILLDEGFETNDKKTLLIHGKGRRVITGLSVSTNRPLVPRTMKRRLRKEVLFLKALGPRAHFAHEGIRDPLYFERLLGALSFWEFIEPECNFPRTGKQTVLRAMKDMDLLLAVTPWGKAELVSVTSGL